jgi:hypothetical protein
MISSAAIQTADLAAAAVVDLRRRLSAALQGRLDEGQCSRTRSRRKNYSIASLVEVVVSAVAHSACVRIFRHLTMSRSTDAQAEGGFGGPQFVFNMGGGPGFTVHQMGGGMPRRRPRTGNEPEQGGFAGLAQLLPLLLLFILPLLSNLFSGSGSSGPSFRFDQPQPPMTMHRVTPKYKIDYYVNPSDVDGWKAGKFHELDKKAEVEYISIMQYQCADESARKRNEIQDAQGFFFTDEARLKRARERKMPACERLNELRVAQRY